MEYMVIEYIGTGNKYYGPFVLLEDIKSRFKEIGINTDQIKEELIPISTLHNDGRIFKISRIYETTELK